MLNCLEFVKNGRLIDGVFTDTLLDSLNITRTNNNEHNFNILGGNMKTRKIGNVWRVAFTDCGGNVQTAEHKSLQVALAMAFINRTTVLGG